VKPGRLARLRPFRAASLASVAAPSFLGYRWLEERDRRRGSADLAGWERAHARTAASFARLGDELGGIFVKLCQVVGARADVFPPVFIRELSRFHDRVTPRPFAELAPLAQAELGRPLGEIFARVDEAPLAAASLAQVHRATLISGAEVVLKLQYPEAARLFASDSASVRFAAGMAARVFPDFPLSRAIEEVIHFISLELDFARELESLERVRKAFGDDGEVRIPLAFPELCTARLLVLEYLDGVPIHELARLRSEGVDLSALADRVARIYRRMIFEHGFFHGDPHPGNLLVLRGGQIGLLDFGLCKALPQGFAAALARMFGCALAQDSAGAVAAARELGFSLDAASDPAAFVRALGIALGARHDFAELRQILAQGISGAIPHDIALVVRTLVLLNGLSERLAPGERRIARELIAGAVSALPAHSA
jgi:ubiquinone biosynthesis protein